MCQFLFHVTGSALSGSAAVGVASGSILSSTPLAIMTTINTKITFALSIAALFAALATGGYLVGRSEAGSSPGSSGKGGTTGGGLPGSTAGGAAAKVGRADGTRPDKARLIGEIIRQAREELQRADWDPHARHRAAWRISSILPEDIPIALGLVGEMAGGYDQESVLTDALLEHWAKTDGRAACEFSLRHRNHGGMIMLSPVRRPLSAWALVDPQGALDWLVGESPAGSDGLVLQERAHRVPISNVRWIFGSWAHVDLDGAIDAFRRLEDPSQISGALVGFTEGAGTVPGRMRLLDFLSETSKEKMHIVNVVDRWATHRPEELAEWIDGEAGMRMEKMYRGYFQQELLYTWLSQDPGAAAEWWLARDPGGRRDLQIKALVEKWADVDLFGAAEWLASQTLDNQMDRSVWILAERMTDTDPESAFTWAASIKEDWIRERALSRVLDRCVRADRTAAEAAVRGADLPEEEEARLLEQMKNGEVTQ